MKSFWVYILCSKRNGTLYCGITGDLPRRIFEHKEGIVPGFTKKFNVHKLVYAEEYSNIQEAIHREKCIKRWKRDWKIALIERANPTWDELCFEAL